MIYAPHPMTLRQLQYAIAVAQHLSFRKAAEACHVSQPSLSAQVALLEEALGVVLFERDKRRVLLTPAGELLLERMARLAVDADALVDAARRSGDPLTAPLRLGVIPTIAPYLLPALTPVLQRRFPRLTPIWTEEKTPVLVSRLAAGELDGVILALEAELGDVEWDVVTRDPFVVAMPVGHRLSADEAPLSTADLALEQVLLLDEGHCFRTQALEYCSGAAIRELAYRATSLGTLAQMVAGGAGLTLLPRLAVPTETRRAQVALRDLSDPVPSRTIVLAWRSRSPLGPSLRTLAGALREAATQAMAE